MCSSDLHWQADSQPLRHQGSPHLEFFKSFLVHTEPPAIGHCDPLVLPFCFSILGDSGLLGDITPLMDLGRVVDFSFFKLFTYF